MTMRKLVIDGLMSIYGAYDTFGQNKSNRDTYEAMSDHQLLHFWADAYKHITEPQEFGCRRTQFSKNWPLEEVQNFEEAE